MLSKLGRSSVETWASKPGFVFVVLFLVCTLAYGLLIPWLHLYIDDWIWVWTWERMGRAGLVRYFATNRPLWGLIFQVTLPLLGKSVIAFHLFSFAVRFASGLACWWLLRLLWPWRPETALISAIFFILYPGFALQPIALTYGHLFLIYLIFLLSLCFHLLALRKTRYYFLYTSLAVFLSAFNLLSMEYFFTLELSRPFFLLLFDMEQKELSMSKRIRWAFIQWLPFLLLFIGIGVWRAFVYKVITERYHLNLVDQIGRSPINALLNLARTILVSFWNVSIGAWLPALNRLGHLNWHLRNSLFTFAVTGVSGVLVFLAMLLFHRSGKKLPAVRQSVVPVIILGMILIFLAGWPFWLTGLEIKPLLDKSRFTIPFILGAAILFAGLIEIIRLHWVKAAVLAILTGLASGYHLQVANTYRIEAEQNRQLMWQIAWRIPNLEEGTTLLITDFPVSTYDTSTMATELNMIYPVVERYPDLAYFILFDREQDQFGLAEGLVKDVPIEDHNVTSYFHGNTSQVLSARYDLSRCFQLLDPSLAAQDITLAEFTRKAVQLSDWKWIKLDQQPSIPSVEWFGSEPANQWCYYFEKAELARQKGDWAAAAQLGDEAQQKGFSARDEMEKLVFIEAYAHTGQWTRAVEQTQSFDNPEKQPVLCWLWNRILLSTPKSAEQAAAAQHILQSGICSQLDAAQ